MKYPNPSGDAPSSIHPSRPLHLPWFSCFFLAMLLAVAAAVGRAGDRVRIAAARELSQPKTAAAAPAPSPTTTPTDGTNTVTGHPRPPRPAPPLPTAPPPQPAGTTKK